MEEASQLTEFGKVFIFLLMGILSVGATLFLSRLIAPRNPTPLKLTSYECGEEPSGSSWVQFNSRFYVIALIFLLFDVEMVFIFPWTTVFAQESLIRAVPEWGWISLVEMFVFVLILIIGLLYVWKKGDLDWIKPSQQIPHVDSAIPRSAYERINLETYRVREFGAEIPVIENIQAPIPAPKPAFKPKFRKPI